MSAVFSWWNKLKKWLKSFMWTNEKGPELLSFRISFIYDKIVKKAEKAFKSRNNGNQNKYARSFFGNVKNRSRWRIFSWCVKNVPATLRVICRHFCDLLPTLGLVGSIWFLSDVTTVHETILTRLVCLHNLPIAQLLRTLGKIVFFF